MARRLGMKDIYVAKVTENTATTYTTATPVKLARALNGKKADKRGMEKLYSDDALEDIVQSYESTELEIEVDTLTPEIRKILFGQKLVKGMLQNNINDIAEDVAIGFRAKNSKGKYEFVWIYVCKAEPTEDSYETQADKPKGQTNKIKFTCRGREKDNMIDVVVNEQHLLETDVEAKTAITNWFSTVQEPIV